jgi:D-alanyl-D-alanine carboxypeptidase
MRPAKSEVILAALAIILVVMLVGQYALRPHTRPQLVIASGTGSGNGNGVNPVIPTPPFRVTTAGVEILDVSTGQVLYAHNPNLRFQVASTTKVMTALLADEHHALDQVVTIAPQDIPDPSLDAAVVGLKPGEQYTVRQLLYGMALASGYDAAMAVARAVGGTEANFVAMMNRRAQELGMNDTHFLNPVGYAFGVASGHYSTAHDMALLMRAFAAHPALVQIFGTIQYTIPANRTHPARPLNRTWGTTLPDSWVGAAPPDTSLPVRDLSLPFRVLAVKKGCIDCKPADYQLSYVLLAQQGTQIVAGAFVGTTQDYYHPNAGDMLPLLLWVFGDCGTPQAHGFC